MSEIIISRVDSGELPVAPKGSELRQYSVGAGDFWVIVPEGTNIKSVIKALVEAGKL